MIRQKTSATIGKTPGLTLALAVLALSATSCRAGSDQVQEVRPPAVAGAFYPASAPELARMVAETIQRAQVPDLKAKPIALVVPHAGYVFSAPVAAAGYKLLQGGDYDTVYVIGAAHYARLDRAAVWKGRAFRTPLGDYPVDLEAVQELLRQCPEIRQQPEAWVREHSVEVQVPFLQQVLPKAKLVPLLMGEASRETMEGVAQALAAQARGRKALFIASTDLSHYPSQADAERIDRQMLQAVAGLDPQAVEAKNRMLMSEGVPQLACTMCGLSAVETVMQAARLLQANRAEVVKYANSGEVAHDRQRVVGYGAVVFWQEPGRPQPSASQAGPQAEETLSAARQQQVLRLARAAIAAQLKIKDQKPPAPSPWMQEKRAVFVTLKKRGGLRGCIGMTEPRLNLFQAVSSMACAAAFEDPRFPPVQAGELKDIGIEVSILSPLRRIRQVDEIQLGRHGVVVRVQGRTGLFLPQVATETGWSKELFLNELCSQKAGLAADAWKRPDTELYIFTVQAFQEQAPGK